MIDYDFFQFACPPRTGTAWFLKATQLSGLGLGFRQQAHIPFLGKRRPDTFRITLVRHPCDWLASCYSVIQRNEVDVDQLDNFRKFNHNSFDDFVLYYLRSNPGAIGRLYSIYTEEADSCIRIEDMPWAFLELMETMEVPESLYSRTKTLTRQNASPVRSLPIWDRMLRRRVAEVEKETIDTYDY